MKNPSIDLEIWRQVNKKWADLDRNDHDVKVDFQLIKSPKDENKIVAIDVLQNIDGDLIVLTVQHIAGEAYSLLGLEGHSSEHLVDAYKEILTQLLSQEEDSTALTVTMSPTSSTSGEVRAVLEKKSLECSKSIRVNYQHYYMLTVICEKMVGAIHNNWSKVTAIYRPDVLEFYFDY